MPERNLNVVRGGESIHEALLNPGETLELTDADTVTIRPPGYVAPEPVTPPATKVTVADSPKPAQTRKPANRKPVARKAPARKPAKKAKKAK